jgi:hypothetical protein
VTIWWCIFYTFLCYIFFFLSFVIASFYYVIFSDWIKQHNC